MAADIVGRIKAGAAAADIAVLARAASHLEVVALELKKAGVQIFLAQTAGLLRSRVVIDVLSLLRAALERGNSNAWYQLGLSRVSQLAPADLVTCVDYSRRKNLPLARVMLADFPPELDETGRTALKKLATDTKLTKEFLGSNKPSLVTYQLLEQSGYFKKLVAEISAGGAGVEDIELINEFLEFVADWEAQHPNATPFNFLADCDRLLEVGEEGEREGSAERGGVQLLTIHSAKGLEFSTVYVVSMIEGRFPGTERSEGIELPAVLVREKIVNDDHHMEEERRLAYVAFTRAKSNLILTWSEKYSSAEGARLRKQSRFISEAELSETTFRSVPAAREDVAEGLSASENNAPLVALNRQKEEYSFTQLKAFESCPYQYWFSHVLRLPVKQKWTMNFGKSMHSALEQWYKLLLEQNNAQQVSLFDTAPAADKTVPSVEKFLEILHRVWIPEGYPSAEFHEEKFHAAEDMIRGYYRKHADLWRVPAHIEQRFKIVIGGELVRGSIDRVDNLPSGGVEIIDYKTGEPKDPEKIKFEDKEQLLIYYLAAERQLKLQPALLTFYYLQNNAAVSFTPTPKDLTKVEEWVADITSEIKHGQFPPKPGQFTCRFCDFKDICPHREL